MSMRPRSTDPHAPGAGRGARYWGLGSGNNSGAEGESIAGSTTIRAISPESLEEEQQQPHGRYTPNAYDRISSPASPLNSHPSSPRIRSRNHRLRAGSSNQVGTSPSFRDQQMLALRPRTRTMEGSTASREPSPPSTYNRVRTRMQSANSVSNPLGAAVEDVVTSIGHPSTIPQPSFTATKRKSDAGKRLGKINHTLRDFPRTQPIVEGSSIPIRQLPPLSAATPEHRADTQNILRLMKSSCGKMEGQLAFRRVETTPWSLSFCSINDETGSLVYEPNNRDAVYKTLIPDLRGCNIISGFDIESGMPYLDVCPQNSKMRVHLRPHTKEEWDAWFAALLCWHPIRPKGAQNRMTKPQASLVGERKLSDTGRHAELNLQREAPVIKFGQMTLWDASVAATPSSPSKAGKSYRIDHIMKRRQQVSCQLRENGELTLHLEQDMSLITTVHLSQLSRCAIQRLDPSLLDTNFCIAIFPQYAATSNVSGFSNPVYLSLESRVVFEAWLVLLRAFTIPQLYGPSEALTTQSPDQKVTTQTTDMFRMERSLTICVVEARLVQPLSPRMPEAPGTHRSDGSNNSKPSGGYYTDVLLDGEIRARTLFKAEEGGSPFWREEFEFVDLPAVMSVASLVLRKRTSNIRSSSKITKEESRRTPSMQNGMWPTHGPGEPPLDEVIGVVDIFLDDLDSGKQVEKWWPLVNQFGQGAGEILVRVVAEESVILMANDYKPMSELLHRFSNGLTLQISQRMTGELKRLSDCLLSIFQVSGSASEWLNNLVEEEIDGTNKEEPQPRVRYPTRRMSSNEAGESTYSSHYSREMMLRDMGKSATVEANLLFRGNTLLTKSLDLHMKRLGKDYLEETLGDKLREIAEKDPDCEVDPNKIVNQNDMDRNWRRLLHYTEQCWSCIVNSALKCPSELRYIFRHIRACADDRYGDFLRTVSYSSVSGFLFLRFFVPAILNPKLFGLLKDHPRPNARRTFTLIAKSLQGLGNMSTFGAKEEWMEAMNSFLTAHRSSFKKLIDNICDVSSTHVQVNIPPAYSTPLAILQRLPPTSREGFPSLPHLIDHAKSFSLLVTLWLDHCSNQAMPDTDSDLSRFHQQCLILRQRTEDCLARAERAERPSSQQDNYEELIELIETCGSSNTTAAGDDSTAFHKLSTSAAATMERPGTSTATSHHSRGDSLNGKPHMSARSTSSGTDSHMTMRSWRGPGRQLSLEILPSSRSFLGAKDAGAKDAPASKPIAPALYDQTSPASNDTSPYGGSDSAVETEENGNQGRKSGRTTPSQNRQPEESRMHRWVHGHGLGMSLVNELSLSSKRAGSESSKDRGSRRAESRNGGSIQTAETDKSRASSSASVHRPSDSRGKDTESAPQPINNGGWSAERVFATPTQRGTTARESQPRSTFRDRGEQLEPGEAQLNMPLHAHPVGSFGSAPRPSSRMSQRAPRRDWTPDERVKREQRTHGIVTAASGSRLHHRSAFSGSADNSSGDEAFHRTDDVEPFDDEAETTALPRFTPQQHAQIIAQAHEKVQGQLATSETSRDRGEKGGPLLERMKWKKRKG